MMATRPSEQYVPGLGTPGDMYTPGSDSSDGVVPIRSQALASDSTSLMSSILKYRQENGRTYHAYKDGCELALPFHPSPLILLVGLTKNVAYHQHTSFQTTTRRRTV